MVEKAARAVAVVGVGAVLPDAPNADAYWENLTQGRYSISEVSPDRWDPALYFDPDPKAPDKTYSTIGGWVRDVDWSPLEWRLPIPPKVSDAMDRTQKWSIVASREALLDYGYPDRPLDADRTAVVLGNAMAGDMHYLTSMRAYFPEYADELTRAPSFAALPADAQAAIVEDFHAGVRNRFPNITEDTMPGELGNIIAGRVANLFNFHGPNFVVDAACASALAAIDAAIEGLENGDYDAVITGGVDANMGVPSFIKFCKIGALSATGTRPYHDGADGFVMGEGAAVILLKRLEDAERDGDHIYAVIRGLGGSSDGKGKGITAPNPVGQEFAVARAWKNAGITPTSATYIEGHGTSTRVGDVVEVESLSRVFAGLGLAPGSIPLGSVKSNIGHLKSSAGAAGMLKAIKALDQKLIPPSLGGTEGNPNIDFSKSPLYINRALAEWKAAPGQVRSAGVSAFGFGGTNFHVVLEEYIPGRLQVNGDQTFPIVTPEPAPAVAGDELKAPLRGALVIGAADEAGLLARLRDVHTAATAGDAPSPQPPAEEDLRAAARVAIDYGDATELAKKTEKAIKALESDNPMMWKPLANQGVFLGRGKPQLTAFLYTGQGSQYVNMLDTLRHTEPLMREVFAEADAVMEPILGRPLTDYIFADGADESALKEADAQLRQTEITQPAVLAVDHALTKLMAAYGIHPDMVMGHSLGEYGALVASGAMPFEDALHAVAGRGKEMANVSVADNGLMAAVFAPIEKIQQVLDTVDGYVVIANINSTQQAVIGGATPAVRMAMDVLSKSGAQVIPLPVSHAFHTEIVAPASEPLGRILTRLRLESPAIPIVANIDGEFYPMGPNVVPKMIEILEKQIASPVQFVKGLRTLYDAGCRVFVEMGPKKALQGMAADVLGDDPEVVTLFSNHPKQGDVVSFNQALCGMYASGHGLGVRPGTAAPTAAPPARAPQTSIETKPAEVPTMTPEKGDMYSELGHLFADFLAKGYEIYSSGEAIPAAKPVGPPPRPAGDRPVVVTGAGLGLPGGERVFGDDKVPAILHGEQFIDTIPVQYRQLIADKHITRLVKSEAGGGHFETIDSQADVIKLAGRAGALDLVSEFGFPAERDDALDQASKLAIGAGLEALRDAGIPLAMHYKTTTTGTKLPERWMLPEAYRDTTGVIFASAFPGVDGMMQEVDRYWENEVRRRRLEDLQSLKQRLTGADSGVAAEIRHRIHELEAELERNPYVFDRKFLFKAVSMGHAQFAEYIGARGPNTQINAACASTTQAVAVAEDWIEAGRCDRVVIISGDDVTSDSLIEWIGSGFLAVGAAATDEVVEEAALPFDRRRHGMILGMGAAALVVESAGSAAQRGIRPIAEVLSAVTANSAFHGSRLDPSHIKHVMEDLVSRAEARWGVNRDEIAPRTVFISHETYTPARGGSAQAEVDALRFVFGDRADDIVVSNTKGFTGHAMGVGVEDVVAVKSIETGIVPPVPNFKEVDPDLGNLNLSRGGTYPIEYALRLGAGFGSQISLTLYRYVPAPGGVRHEPDELGFEGRIADGATWSRWLADVTGISSASVEVERRTLRVVDNGIPTATGVPTTTTAATPEIQPETPEVRPQTPDIAPAAAGAPAAATAAPTAADPVAERVLALVAEQTGYPPDMLDLDLDLEADLGIDTVKQAETFAAIREAYGIERDDSLALRDYPTLNDVIGFVYERAEGLEAPAPVVATAEVSPHTPEEAPTAPTAPAASGAADPVAVKVLEVVAEQTGYPTDMLDLDADLEADLGIDTVKQAETFAAIREAYGIERDDSLALRDYPTLNDVIGFVYERAEGLGTAAAPPPTEEPETGAAQQTLAVDDTADSGPALIRGDDQAAAAVPRRIPTAVLRPPLDHCVATGVVLGEGSRVVVMLDHGGIGTALVERLEKRGVAVLAIDDAPPAEELLARIDEFAADGQVTGVYWLPALDVEPAVADMELDDWREALRRRVKLLYATMRHLYSHGGDTGVFLVSGSRLGGRHGYDEAGAVAPMGGAVTGFTKAYKREKPAALVKAVDFPTGRKTAAHADVLIAETLADPGAVEIGIYADRRWTIGLTEQPLPNEGGGIELGPDSVVVVTGAAGSIVSAITADLARACGGTFHLLDLVETPDPTDEDVIAFGADKDQLKRTIFERLKEAEGRATPAMVDRELAGIERRHAALAAVQAIEAAGGTVHYHSVNLLDADAVGAATEAAAATTGKVDLLLHAGGLEISRLLPDKEPAEYDLVFDVKADGWFNLLRGLGDTPLGAAVVFSSVAGRFGNNGQTDYSAANDLLCKSTSSFKTSRPDTLGVALDWTAWGDIGMATRGSIPTVMKAAGIDMLPAAAGIPIVRREVTGRTETGEQVVGLRLGILLDEHHPTGGLDVGGDGPVASQLGGGKVEVHGVVGYGIYEGFTVTAELNPTEQPFLHDHQIDGTPVLPGVMGMEAFAETAAFLHPELTVVAVEDVDFLAPFKFYRNEPRVVTITAQFVADGDETLAHCRLIGERQLVGQDEPQRTLHFTGTVRLGPNPPDLGRTEVADPVGAAAGPESIYQIYFHGPAYQVLAAAWGIDGGAAGRMASELPPNHVPASRSTVTHPRLAELAFQASGIWEIGTTGTMALPMRVGRVRFGGDPDAADGAITAMVQPGDDEFTVRVADASGATFVVMEGYKTVSLPTQVPDAAVAPLRAALGEHG